MFVPSYSMFRGMLVGHVGVLMSIGIHSVGINSVGWRCRSSSREHEDEGGGNGDCRCHQQEASLSPALVRLSVR